MFKDIKIIIEENKDIKKSFEKLLGEKYLLSTIIEYADKTQFEKYIEWKHNLPKNETVYQKYIRGHKMAVHAFKYNKKAIREYDLRGGNGLVILFDNIEQADDIHKDDVRSYIEYTKMPTPQRPPEIPVRQGQVENNYFIINRMFDILNCISFRKYKPGSIFNLYIGGNIFSTFTITKENRYNLFSPIRNKPIFLVSILYNEVSITSPNTLLTKPIYLYGTYVNAKDRNALLESRQECLLSFFGM
jgi:hypothetical protein